MNALRAAAAFALPLFLCAPLPALAENAASAQAAALVKASGDALHAGAMRNIRVLHLQGTTVVVGLHGTAQSWNEIGGWRTSQVFNAAPMGGGNGWDGRENWNLDQTGLLMVDASTSGRSAAIAQAFISNYDLWKPNYGGASISYIGVKHNKAQSFDVLNVRVPGSQLPIDLWFDRKTHLLSRTIQSAGPFTLTSSFSDYHAVKGLLVPFTVSTDANGNVTGFTATSADVNPADGSAKLSKPVSKPHDFSIGKGRRQTTVPFMLSENHVYVDLMLNGKGPYHFIFDTGGSNLIDPAVAKEIGATSAGQFQASGVGNVTESSAFATVKSLKIGDAEVNNQLFAVVPVRQGFGMTAGLPADGLIGYEVLSRFVTTFDYADKTVTFYAQGAYQAPAGATVVPISQDGTQPQFACGIDGVPTTCTVDTGARDSLTLFTPFLQSHPNVMPTTLTQSGVTGFGVGGPAIGRLGRLSTLSFGTFTLPELVGDFTEQKQGAFAMPFIGANVGGAVWKRFNVTFDYNALTMTLVPNAAYATRDSWDRSGMFLINNGAVRVIDSRPGTPAAQAGIEKGDVITTVNGASAAAMGLRGIRDALMAPAGTVVHLNVKKKDGTSKDVDLTLADYV